MNEWPEWRGKVGWRMGDKRISLRLPEEVWAGVKAEAVFAGQSLNAQIVYWLKERLLQVRDERARERLARQIIRGQQARRGR